MKTSVVYKDAKNNPKEARMKKLILVLLAVFLVIPALSNAGSVSSRYDVTFGGFVKFDGGWATDNTNADPYISGRDSATGREYLADEYSNTFMTGAETRLNFLIKGPDLWGAKTSAFIEGDFRGVSTGNAYGGFQLRHAFMTMNWQSAELMIGQNWQQWGMPYYPAALGFNDNSTFLKGLRMPQIAFRYFFTKEFNAMVGVQSATDWAGSTRGANDDYARSEWPGVMGEIAYWSDRCGKIGANNLKFGLGGFYGKEKKINALNAAGDPLVNPYASPSASYYDDETNAWMAAFRYSVPIIPEKQGNKQFALLLNGNFFYGQNWAGNAWQNVPNQIVSAGSYFRDGGDAVAPVGYGLFTQLSFWFTNNLWANLQYGYLKYNYSSPARSDSPGFVNMNQNYAANLMWDANQAVRFGLQWNRIYTGYNRSSAPGVDDRTGTMDVYRVAAWYFF
ncbi:MAG: hypothetical protein H6Q52_870 [Deltaproteobacteria bacterium]|nr:hypothetical protein [Deltaproteobacteria bacterium]